MTSCLQSSGAGYPLSATHVISGSIMGSGAAKRLSAVRWGVAGNIVGAWTPTLPAAAFMGARVYAISTLFGHGEIGPLVISAALLLMLSAVFIRRLQQSAPATPGAHASARASGYARFATAIATGNQLHRRSCARFGRPAGAGASRPLAAPVRDRRSSASSEEQGFNAVGRSPEIRQSRDARRRRRSTAEADQLGIALRHELECDAGAGSAVTKVLADRPTRAGQQAPRRCRSHRPRRRQLEPSDLFPDGRKRGVSLSPGEAAARAAPFRPLGRRPMP